MSAAADPPEGGAPSPRGRARRGLLLGVACLAAAAGGVFSWRRHAAREAARRADEAAVTLFYQQTLPDSAGAVFRFEQLRGRQVVANFWASWCAPCVEEMPELSALAAEVSASGTRFVGVGVDNPEAVAKFAQKVPVTYPLVVANATGAFLAARFGNAGGGLPYTVVIGPTGQVKAKILGRVSIDSLREVIKSDESP